MLYFYFAVIVSGCKSITLWPTVKRPLAVFRVLGILFLVLNRISPRHNVLLACHADGRAKMAGERSVAGKTREPVEVLDIEVGSILYELKGMVDAVGGKPCSEVGIFGESTDYVGEVVVVGAEFAGHRLFVQVGVGVELLFLHDAEQLCIECPLFGVFLNCRG